MLIQPFCMALDSDTQKVIDMAYFVEFIPVKETFLMSIFSTILKGKLTHSCTANMQIKYLKRKSEWNLFYLPKLAKSTWSGNFYCGGGGVCFKMYQFLCFRNMYLSKLFYDEKIEGIRWLSPNSKFSSKLLFYLLSHLMPFIRALALTVISVINFPLTLLLTTLCFSSIFEILP